MSSFSGNLVAIVTPMRADGTLDLEAWAWLIDWHLQSGTAGIVVGGTTGESVALGTEELATLVQRACAQSRGRIAVIAGAGTSSTERTVHRVRALSQLPIQGLLIVTPAYNKPTQEGLYRHFAAAAAAARVPIIAYNVPARTAVDLLPHTVARIAALPQIAGIKEAVPRIERIRELRALCPAEFAVLSGDDATAREAVLAGAQGVISVTANVAPAAMAEMVAAARRADRAQAEHIDATLESLHRALFIEPNPIPVKWALARLGRIGEAIRLPLTVLSAEYHGAVTEALRRAGLLSS